MKKLFAVLLGASLCLLSACGAEPGAEAGLVFVNDSDAVIVSVTIDFENQGKEAQAK